MTRIVVDLANPEPYFNFPAALFGKICARFPEHRFTYVADDLQRESHLREAEVYWGWRLDEGMVQAAPGLKWVMFAGEGVGGGLLPVLHERGIAVTHTAGIRAPAVAEHAFALLLSLTRRLGEAGQAHLSRQWGKPDLLRLQPLPGELNGRTLVLLGHGRVGSRIARIAKLGFEMRVLVVRRHPDRPAPHADEVFAPTKPQLSDAVRQADVLVMALPRAPGCEGILCSDVISDIKPGALLVNVGHPCAIDEPALLTALRFRRIGGVAFDRFPAEPLPGDSPWWTLERVIVSPHVAGVTPRLWSRMSELFVENLARHLRGEPLLNQVTP